MAYVSHPRGNKDPTRATQNHGLCVSPFWKPKFDTRIKTIFPHFITTARFHWSRNYGNTLMLQTVFPTLLFFLDLALAGIIHITSPMLGSDYLFVRYFGKTLLNCSSLCCKWEHVLLYLDHRFAPLIIYSRHFRFFFFATSANIDCLKIFFSHAFVMGSSAMYFCIHVT